MLQLIIIALITYTCGRLLRKQYLKRQIEISKAIDFNYLNGQACLVVTRGDSSVHSQTVSIEELIKYSETGEEIELKADDLLPGIDEELFNEVFPYIVSNGLLNVDLDFLIENPQLFKQIGQTNLRRYEADVVGTLSTDSGITYFSILMNQSPQAFFIKENGKNLNITIEMVVGEYKVNLTYILPSAYLVSYRNENEAF